MRKKLPWFKFNPTEWQNGDLAFMAPEAKGIFIDLCSFYWYRGCDLKKSIIDNRFASYQNELNQLIESEVIKLDNNENIHISFLKEQWDTRQQEHRRNVENGRKGGKKRAKNASPPQAPLKPPSSILEQEVLIQGETGFKL